MGLQKWIEQQLSPDRIDDHALDARLQRLETLTLDSQTIQRDYEAPAMMERRQRQQEKPDADADPQDPGDAPRPAKRSAAQGARGRSPTWKRQRSCAPSTASASSKKCWSTSGSTTSTSSPARARRETTSPNTSARRFARTCSATSATCSARPRSIRRCSSIWTTGSSGGGAQGAGVRRVRRGAQRSSVDGINENYARELLELHTLGVDGGYTQQDIVNVARAFTGWTMQPRMGTGFGSCRRATIAARRRCSATRSRPAAASTTASECSISSRASRDRASHRAKLAMRFVSDTPPPALVDRVAARFSRDQGRFARGHENDPDVA